MRDAEYDRFGPWTIEISQEDPPPALFLPYLTREETPLLSVKIPRKIERRNADPGMNLYDYLVSLYENDLGILQRIGDDVRLENFFYSDIQFLRYGENLLKGSLYLSTAEKSFELPFNTTSKDIMRRVAKLIRCRYGAGEASVVVPDQAHIPSPELSFYFTRLLAQENARRPDRRLLASQPDTLIGSAERGVLRRLLFGAISKTLMESLHMSDGRELKIITRSKPFKYRWQTEYGADYVYLPLRNISGVSWQDDAWNTAVISLNLQTPGETITFPFIRDNPWIGNYDKVLTAVTTSEPAGVN